MPINVHRIIANVAFGGSVAAAYAAFKFLQAETDEERAHYDWMGYIGNFVAISAFLPLPFAGYWLAKEIYAFSQTLGLTMMGGAFSWLFIIQAVLIGNLFLAANYYLWLGMGRVEGVQPLQKFIKYLLIGIALCFMVWATPRSIIATVSELRAMGGSSHPILGYLGVMSAKNTAVNILILTTFMSFLLYRRTGKIATVAWAKTGHAAQLAIFAAAAVYRHLPRRLRLLRRGDGPDQALGAAGPLGPVRDGVDHRHRRLPLPRRAEDGRGALGQDPGDLAVRADLHRGHLHLADGAHGLRSLRAPPALACLRRHSRQSVDAFTPTLGFATKVVSVTVLLFFLLIGFVFWIASLHDRTKARLGERRRPNGADHEDPAHRPDRRSRPRDDRVLYLCRPDGAAEGSAASAGDRHQKRPDHGRHGQGRPRDHGGQGTLPHLPHDRQDRGAPVPRPRGSRCPREDPRARA